MGFMSLFLVIFIIFIFSLFHSDIISFIQTFNSVEEREKAALTYSFINYY